jgi:hypothetical protein
MEDFMHTVEFNSYVKNGAIAIPDDLISVIQNEVHVTVEPKREPNSAKKRHPYAGCMKGVFTCMSDDFNEPLDDFKEYM